MLTQDQRDELVEKIEHVHHEVNESVIEEMYRNPFWKERYGERGLKQSNKDAASNLKYLEAAIRMDTTAPLEQYYNWLRGALVYRGMCTLHLEQTLDCTGRHLARLLQEDWTAIEPYHRAGYLGLAYRQPAAQALRARSQEIAQATTGRMLDPARTGSPSSEKARQACLRDNLYHLSYLADAVEVEKEDLFVQYVHWVTGFLAPFGVEASSIQEDLRVLREETGTVLPEEHARPFLHMIERVLTG